MSSQVILWDEHGYRTSQASAAESVAGAPHLPTLLSRRHALAEFDHTQAGGSEVLNAGVRGEPKGTKPKARALVVKQPFPPKWNSGGFSLNVLFMLFGLMHIAPAGIKGTVIGMILFPLAAFPVLPVVSFVCPIHTYAHAIA